MNYVYVIAFCFGVGLACIIISSIKIMLEDKNQ